jgi:hypothetical protein
MVLSLMDARAVLAAGARLGGDLSRQVEDLGAADRGG